MFSYTVGLVHMAYDAVRPSPFHVLNPNGFHSKRLPPALLDSNWTGSRIRFQQFRPVVVHGERQLNPLILIPFQSPLAMPSLLVPRNQLESFLD